MGDKPKRFRKIDLYELLADLSADHRRTVEWDYEHRPEPVLPALPYTEGQRTWIALYLHCRAGQIDPAVMRRMKARRPGVPRRDRAAR
jgi:hypothetical protein